MFNRKSLIFSGKSHIFRGKQDMFSGKLRQGHWGIAVHACGLSALEDVELEELLLQEAEKAGSGLTDDLSG